MSKFAHSAYSYIDSLLSDLNISTSPRNYFISDREYLLDLPDDVGGLYIIYSTPQECYSIYSPEFKCVILYVGSTRRNLKECITKHTHFTNENQLIGSHIMFYPLKWNKTRLTNLEQDVIEILQSSHNQS